MSPDGKYLAIAYGAGNKDPNAAVKETGWELVLWDLAARKVVGTRRGDGERWQLTNLTFSPDGTLLAGNAAGYDKTIDWYKSVALVWGVPNLAQKHTLETRAFRYAGFSSMSFTREGDASVLRAFDWGSIHRWDLATGKALEIVSCDYGNRFPTGSAFSPDGKTIAVVSEVVNESTGKRLGAEVTLRLPAIGVSPRDQSLHRFPTVHQSLGAPDSEEPTKKRKGKAVPQSSRPKRWKMPYLHESRRSPLRTLPATGS